MSEPLRVLTVEDNEADSVLALRELKRAGLNCVGCRVDTEEEYRRQLEQFRPDVILSDFAMPRFDGMAALTIARESYPDVPFIFLSGTIGEEYAIRALKSGATDYVLKENLIRLPPAVERAINEAKRLAAQRDVEERQRKIERRFRALIENSSEAVMLTGPEGTVLYASPATVRVLGYARGDQEGRNAFELVHPQDLPDWSARLDATSKNPGKPNPFQCRVRHKDGSWRVLDGTLSNLTGDPAIGAVVVNFRDVTSTARAEQLRALEHSVNRCLADASSVSGALKTVMRAICETERWECGRFFKPDEEADVLRCVEHWGIPGDRIDRFIEKSRGLEYGPSEGLAGRVWQSGQPVWVADVTTESGVSTRLGPDAGMRGAFVFPIMSDGRTIGVLAFNSSEVREPDAPLLQAVRVIGSQIGQWLRRKYAEEELLRFRASMDLSGDMIVLIDHATMRFADVNDTACRLLGYSREDLLRMGPQDIVPESREELARIYDEMIANAASHDSMKSRYIRKDGSSFPFESTRRVLRSGDSWLIVAISRDISERIASEAALRESNERFDSAVRATNDVIWDWNFATGELWWNENLAEVFGYRIEEIDRTNRFREDSIHPADRQRVASGVDNAVKSGEENWGDEYRFRRRDGTYAFVYDRGRLIRDGSGKPVRMIGAMADVTARKEAEQRLSYLAQFDTLTNLPNRHLFRDRLAQTLVQAQRGHGQVGVMFVDLDRFKNVNDTLGHEAGDKLLVLVAASLNESLREGDTVGRISGDEFAIVLANLAKAEDAAIVARKVINGLAHSFDVAGHKVFVTASIGISVSPNDGTDAETLLKNSNTAMHRAKEQGRNGYQFYLPAMNERAMHRLQLETGLRVALERSEFLLHYQPKIDLASNSISGFEALLRWQHPERGLIPPAQFIPILEDTGLIVPVGEWVLLQACRQIEGWRAQGIEPRPVAVNLSARQFQQKNLDEVIARVLKETGIDPAHLELELTESMLMHDAAEAARTLQTLKNYGIRLAVDDFGTGYSSLAYLRRFPIDALKVDRAFIHDLTTNAEDATITLAIINLAHSLKLGVVAEGVETSAQVSFLKENGCDEAQGFYFARPLAIEECTKTLVEKRRFH